MKDLCSGLPKEFESYQTYVRGLSYGEYADYDYMRTLFHLAYAKQGYEVDEPRVYDWTEMGKEWNCWAESGAPPRWKGELEKGIKIRDDMPEAPIREPEALPAVVVGGNAPTAADTAPAADPPPASA